MIRTVIVGSTATIFLGLVACYVILTTGTGTKAIARDTISDISAGFLVDGMKIDKSSITCGRPVRADREIPFEFVLECHFPTSCGRDVRVYVLASLLAGGRIGPDPLEEFVARECEADVRLEVLERVYKDMRRGG